MDCDISMEENLSWGTDYDFASLFHIHVPRIRHGFEFCKNIVVSATKDIQGDFEFCVLFCMQSIILFFCKNEHDLVYLT